jgi:hypothetical protein
VRDWGLRLADQAAAFDMGGMAATLEGYVELLERVRSVSER